MTFLLFIANVINYDYISAQPEYMIYPPPHVKPARYRACLASSGNPTQYQKYYNIQ